MEKPSLPKGTRDFGPGQMAKRQFILDNIRQVFRKYGFMPLETPAMENLSTLTGKYGEEGDQLLFRILNSGDFLKDINRTELGAANSKAITTGIAEKGLRYDLTVPFARYVVMNRHEITMPFRRYQIQPVWRADRPQKGRYREFFQCDADVVGTDSLVCEAEIILMIREAFKQLSIEDYDIKINHREILSGIVDALDLGEKETQVLVGIDKLDKIGAEGVREELLSKGVTGGALDTIFKLIAGNRPTDKKFSDLDEFSAKSARVQKGVADIKTILETLKSFGSNSDHVDFDVSLARGLSYYTGCIFEVKINNVAVGSVCGGGRYDNLVEAFGSKEKLSGVGISFGIDRIYDAMEELNIFPKEAIQSTKVLICHFDEEAMKYGLKILGTLRDRGISSEIYPDLKKLNKQLEYADKKGIAYAVVIGPDEVKSGKLSFKNLTSGEQQTATLAEVIDKLSNV